MISYLKKQSRHFRRSLKIVFYTLIVLWVVFLLDVLNGFTWYESFGLYPRNIAGLKGIFFSPLLHGGVEHILSNSGPLAFILFMILFFYRNTAFSAILMIYLLTGFFVWVFGRPVFHIGASGVVYGFVSFVFWSGVFLRNMKSVVLALIVAVLYSGLFLGILPNQEGISWESHLIGGIVGILVAYLLRNSTTKDLPRKSNPFENEEKTYFFDRDTFNKF